MDDDRTYEQKRAAHALKEIKDIDGKASEHFTSYISALPASIVMNGLGQAMAFEKSNKNDKGHKDLYEIMERWLCGKSGVFNEETDLMNAITNKGQNEYLRAQAEALAYLDWLKKFSRAYIDRK